MAEYKSAIETLISGTSGKDTVTLTGISYSTVQGGAGNDTIYARWGSNYNRYEGEAGNDIIIANYDAVKSGESSTLGGGNANTISGGAGNDTIYLGGYDNTHGGKTIRSYSSVIEYSNDDGNDVIIDTLGGGYSDYKIKLTAGLLSSTEVSGSNIILKVAPSAASTSSVTGAITLLGAKGSTVSLTGAGEISITRNDDVKSKVTVQSGDDAYMSNGSTLIGGGADVTVTNRGERVSIGGTYGQVENYGSKVTITGGKTAVSIDNRGTNSVIKGSTVAGGDYIFNYNDGNKINGDKGDDFIVNYQGNKTSITGGAGNDAISILGGQAVTVNGDAGKDYIYNEVKGAVILGGKDDDEISLKSGSSAVIKYAKAEGNDVIYGFNSSDTLNVTSGTIKKVAVDGADLVVTVDKQTITLKDAANDNINLQYGTFGTVVTNSSTATTSGWIVQDGVATYGTAAKPIVQITGVSADATSASFLANAKGTSVTVMGSALGDETLKVTKGSAKLVLASKGSDTVRVAKTTTKGKWLIPDTTALYYAATTTDGYTLSSDKKSVTHTAASEHGGELTAIITGIAKGAVASNFKMDESTGTITLLKGALPAGTTTGIKLISPLEDVTNKLALDSKVTQYKVTDPGWTVSGTTATYKTGTTTAGFVLADDGQSISYNSNAAKATTMATITGLKKGVKAYSVFANSKDNTITLTKDMIGTTNISLNLVATGVASLDSVVSDWKLGLASDIAQPTYTKEAYWATVKGGYTLYTPKVATAGYTLSGNTVIYSKAKSGGTKSVSLTGLRSDLEYTDKAVVTADIKGTLQGVDYDITANEFVIGASAVDTDSAVNVKISGTVTKGAVFKLADDLVAGEEEFTTLTNSTSTAIALEGNDGDNALIGGKGAETLIGGAGKDSLNAGDGNDMLYSGTGTAKTLVGGKGNDTLVAQNTGIIYDPEADDAPSVVLNAGDGNDVVSLVGGAASVSGGAGTDKLYGNAGADTLQGDAGKDTLIGGAGNDVLFGGNAADSLKSDDADYLDGGAGNDTLKGGLGNDVMHGGMGNDSLVGDAGNDKMYGDDGNDTLYGGAGNDTLEGGAGIDILEGDAGNDRLVSGTGTAKTLSGGAGNDTLIAENTGFTITEGDDDSEAVVSVVLDGGAGNDVLRASTITGGGGGSLSGGAGTDTLYGGTGEVTLTGGAGNDTFIYSTTYEANIISDYSYNASTKKGDVIKLTDYSAKSATFTKDEEKEEVYIKLGQTGPVLTVKFGEEDFDSAAIYLSGVVGKKTDSVTKKVSAITAVESGLFAEDNFVAADDLSQIVETSSVGEFDLNAKSDKLQAENLITYAEK